MTVARSETFAPPTPRTPRISRPSALRCAHMRADRGSTTDGLPRPSPSRPARSRRPCGSTASRRKQRRTGCTLRAPRTGAWLSLSASSGEGSSEKRAVGPVGSDDGRSRVDSTLRSRCGRTRRAVRPPIVAGGVRRSDRRRAAATRYERHESATSSLPTRSSRASARSVWSGGLQNARLTASSSISTENVKTTSAPARDSSRPCSDGNCSSISGMSGALSTVPTLSGVARISSGGRTSSTSARRNGRPSPVCVVDIPMMMGATVVRVNTHVRLLGVPTSERARVPRLPNPIPKRDPEPAESGAGCAPSSRRGSALPTVR